MNCPKPGRFVNRPYGHAIFEREIVPMKKEKKKPRRNHVISTRISCAELQLLETTSRNRNKSISDLLREALRAIAPPETSYPNS